MPPPMPTRRGVHRPDLGVALLWAVRVGIVLVLLTPLIVNRDLYFPFVVGKAVYARSVIEITFAIWVALILFHRQHRPHPSWILLAFGAWVAVSWVAALLGVSPTRSLWSTYERMQGVFDLVHWFAFIVMAASVFRSPAAWRGLLGIGLGLGTLVCALALGPYYGVLSSNLAGSAEPMLFGTLGNPAYVGAYAMINALLGVGLLLWSFGCPERDEPAPKTPVARRRGAKRRRPGFNKGPWVGGLCTIAISINLWAMWLSGMRSALAGLLAGCLAFALAYIAWGSKRSVKKAALAMIVAAAAVVALFPITRLPELAPIVDASWMLSKISWTDLDDPNVIGRLTSAAAGLRAFQDKPLLGWGPENYLIGWGRHFDKDTALEQERFDQAHNKLLEELTTKGAIGLSAYLSIWVAMAYVMIKSFRCRSGYDQFVIGVMGAALIAYFVQNLFLFDSPSTLVPFSILVAYAVWRESRIGVGEGARSAGWARMPALWQRWSARFSGTVSATAAASTAVAVTALVLASLLLCNARVYSAAASALDGTRQHRVWADRVASYRRSIREFPGLANSVRMQLIADAAAEFREMFQGKSRMSDQAFRETVDLVLTEGGAGLGTEPENWLLEAWLAQFLQLAALRNPTYLGVARTHVERALARAPRTHEATSVLEAQERIEELLDRG